MTLDPQVLVGLVKPYLERQQWYQNAIAGTADGPFELIAFDVLSDGPPGFGRLIVALGDRRFQILVGWRTPVDFWTALASREHALIGPYQTDDGQLLVYDALSDDELCLTLLTIVSDGAESAALVRQVSSLVSHAALVFDERLFMKCYRVLETGARPEAEVVFRLDKIGFNAMLAPVARWRDHGHDLALVREFLPSALEGRLLALTSLRDLLARATDRAHGYAGHTPPGRFLDPMVSDRATATAGGDLASEMTRLGQMTARLHVALAQAFGERDADPSRLVEDLRATMEDDAHRANALPTIDPHERDALQIIESIAQLKKADVGRAIRLHGEYHLRRVMRSEPGWVVAGFSDDPLYTAPGPNASLPPRTGSPVEDLADMCFALTVVANEALTQRPTAGAAAASALAAAWCRRNQDAFMQGYLSMTFARFLLPRDPEVVSLLLSGYELLRERRYDATSRED